ncbi:MAG: anaerobic ribonucleoside-triphosphate reductase activating protein [Prosthecochloris sp.]|nr:anaerobic ribonucleoside-triphosphate reductase activating protein [Prosthecochloris sp.]
MNRVVSATPGELVAHGEKAVSAVLPGGFLKQSFIDWPGHIAAVLYTTGCNMRCVYCHNPGLVRPELIRPYGAVECRRIADWLVGNRNLLDGVVVSGGEPTLQRRLPGFLQWLRSCGFRVKLDTNGTNPQLLEELLHEHLVDAVSMDLKAPLELQAHREVCGRGITSAMVDRISRSLELLQAWDGEVEIRSTLFRPFHDHRAIREMYRSVTGTWTIQSYSPRVTLEPMEAAPCEKEDILDMLGAGDDKAVGIRFR